MGDEKNGGKARPDAVLDGTIQPTPIMSGVMAENPEAKKIAELEARLAAQSQAAKDAADAARLAADRDRVSAALSAHRDAVVGDAPGDLKLRDQLATLQLTLSQSGFEGDKTAAWYIGRARELAEARSREIIETGTDGAVTVPAEGLSGPGGAYSVHGLLRGLMDTIRTGGGRGLDADRLSGSPEAEHATELAKRPEVRARLSALAPSHGRGAVIPMPIKALTGSAPAQLAETYAGQVATRAVPTYRRDLLVPFFRPGLVLMSLGVPMPTISNNQRLPDVTASLTASWVAENAAIGDSGITTGVKTTAPKRLGVRDDLSWMLLAAADDTFGTPELVAYEMAAAVAQAKELAVFAGTGQNNQPRGISNTTGVTAQALAGGHPTYREMLAMPRKVADENIPVDAYRTVLTPYAQEDLQTIQRYIVANAGGAVSTPIWRERSPDAMQVREGYASSMGTVAGRDAYISNILPKNLGSGSKMHLMIGGVWSYAICWDYAVAYLTIDDVSLALNGQTRMVFNSYHDVTIRLPKAFVTTMWNPGA